MKQAFLDEINRHKLRYVLIVLYLIVSFVTMGILFHTLYRAQMRSTHLNTKQQRIQLTDFQTNDDAFLRDPSAVQSLKGFLRELSKSERWEYDPGFLQPAFLADFKGSETFLHDYEYGEAQPPKEHDHHLISEVKQVYVSEVGIKHARLQEQITNGRCFEKKDYVFEKGRSIPVILGAEYEGIYKTGDRLLAEIATQEDLVTCQVVGMLQKNTSMTIKDQVTFLDRYILIPTYEEEAAPSTKEEIWGQGMMQLQKSGGVIYLSENISYDTFLSELEKLRLQYGVMEFGTIGNSPLSQNTKKLLVYENIGVLTVLFFSALVFHGLTFLCYMISSIRNSIYRYKVFLLSGYGRSDIENLIYAELEGTLLPAWLLAFLSVVLLFPDAMFPKLLFLGFAGTLQYLVSKFFVHRYFARITLEQLMRGDTYD